jgi:HPt (histidine-containing phosphotransfer) domain-containing protein
VLPVQDPDEAIRAVMVRLAASARAANLARTAVIEQALAALAAGHLDPGEREAAVQAAHQVVGSAGTFGRRRSSELAADLEDWFGPPLDAADLAGARAWVAELRADLEVDDEGVDGDRVDGDRVDGDGVDGDGVDGYGDGEPHQDDF